MRNTVTNKVQGFWQVRRLLIRFALTVLMIGAGRIRKRPVIRERSRKGLHFLLTGTFYSRNWIDAQLLPLTHADGISKVTFVSSTPIADTVGIDVIYPPKLLQRLIGRVPARLCMFFWQGVRERPDVIGGYHLLINGLFALLIARLTKSRSLYICVGGPTEVLGGGFSTENRIFGRLKQPDPKIERQLLSAIDTFDCVVVRGHSAKAYFEGCKIKTQIRIITAGVDPARFSPSGVRPEYDLVFLGRLSAVKRVELFLQVVELMKQGSTPKIRALIIGDGPARETAEKFVRNKDLESNVEMVGQQDDVASYLNAAKVFVLTSKSEGLSQAMVQAMLCGLPAVVANVGALADLVENDRGGYLIDDHSTASAYIEPIDALLRDSGKLQEMGSLARQSALRCSVERVADKWDRLVEEVFDVCQRKGS